MKLKYKTQIGVLLCLCCCLQAGRVVAVTTYEEEIAETLFQRTDRGQPVWLYEEGQRFLGLYSQSLMDEARGAAIIVHGMGGHPDWPEVVAPIRNRLPAAGWATLSIQLPVLDPGDPLADYGKTTDDAANRIREAVRFLRDRKFLNIVIIGYSFGAVTAVNSLATGQPVVQAFVGISMQTYEFLNPRMYVDEALTQIDLPVLDVYGSRDYEDVIGHAEQRRQLARRDNRKQFTQLVIDGADHNFIGLEDILIGRILGWLDLAAPGLRVPADGQRNDQLQDEPSAAEPVPTPAR